MPALTATVLVDAPPRTVAGHLRDVELWGAAAERVGHRVRAARRLLSPGDEVRVSNGRTSLDVVVTSVRETGLAALATGPPTGLHHAITLDPSGAGTRVRDEIRWTATAPSTDSALAGAARRWLDARAEVLAERAAAASSVVVATALIRDGRVLIAQRTRPPALAGRWELPGGRVETGEPEPAAVARECREEMGIAVRATGRLGTDLPIDAGLLRVHTAELLPGAPQPRALEHSALRWVGRDELATVDWVEADRAVVADLLRLLAVPPGPRPAG